MYTVQGELRAVCDRGLPAQGNKKAESLSLSGTPLLITTSNSLGRRIITSDVEQEIHYVAVVYDIFLSFGPHLPCFLRALLTLECNEVVEGDGLRANKHALEIRVNSAGGLRRGVADMNRPRPHFLHARREIRLQAEQLVTRANHAIQPRFFHTDIGEQLPPVEI